MWGRAGGVQPGPVREVNGKELGYLKKIKVRFLAPMSNGSQLPVTPAPGDFKLLTSIGTYTHVHIFIHKPIYIHIT